MTVQGLVSATTHSKQFKGQIIGHFRDISLAQEGSSIFEGKEVPPAYVVVEITGTTAAQVENFLQKTKDIITYEIVTAGGLHTITATLHPKLVANFNRGFKQEMRDYLEDTYGAIFTSWEPVLGTAVFTTPDTVVLQDVKDDVLDLFSETLGPRYKFAEADVDTAIAAGGFISITKAVALNIIVDRLA